MLLQSGAAFCERLCRLPRHALFILQRLQADISIKCETTTCEIHAVCMYVGRGGHQAGVWSVRAACNLMHIERKFID